MLRYWTRHQLVRLPVRAHLAEVAVRQLQTSLLSSFIKSQRIPVYDFRV